MPAAPSKAELVPMLAPTHACVCRDSHSTAHVHTSCHPLPGHPQTLQSPQEGRWPPAALPEAAAHVQLVLTRPQPVVTHWTLAGRARLAGARQMGDTRAPSRAGEESLSRVMSLLRV